MDLDAVVKKEVLRHLKSLCPDAQILAFGSRVSGKSKKYSDLEICLKTRGNRIPFQTLEALDARFAESNIPLKIDIIDYHSVDEGFQKIIDKTSVELALT